MRSLDPRPARGFHHACEDVQPEAGYVVYPGSEAFMVSEGVEAIGLGDFVRTSVYGRPDRRVLCRV